MKKKKLKSLALLGIATGMLVSNHLEAQGSQSTSIRTAEGESVLLASKCGAGKCSNYSATGSCANSSPKNGANAACGAGKCGSSHPKTIADAACGAGKCGSSHPKTIADAACGAGKCGSSHPKTIADAACGAGKCGSSSRKNIADNEPKKSLTAPVPLNTDDPNAGNITYHLMTEDELLIQLNDEGVKIYNSLTPEGKALAREVASQACNGTNKCKGLNACKTDKNACAGQGGCKGQSICGMGDKNLAVKIVAKKMAQKREALSQPSAK